MSVFSQSFQNYRVHIVDDFSTDLEFEKLKEIIKNTDSKNRVNLYRSVENFGPGFCRNYCLSLCRSKYVCFLDSDDEWYQEKLLNQVQFMDKNKSIFSYHYYTRVLEDKTTTVKTAPNKLHSKNFLYSRGIGYCISMMLRSSSLSSLHLFPAKGEKNEDYKGFYQYINSGNYEGDCLKQTLAAVHVVTESRSSNKISIALDVFFYICKTKGIVIGTCYFIVYLFNASRIYFKL